VPGEEYGTRGLTTASETIMKDSRGQLPKAPMPPHVFTQVSQQAQIKMFRQAQARHGLPPIPRLGSATTEDEKLDNLVFRPPEFELRRRQNLQKRSFQKSYQQLQGVRVTPPSDATGFYSPKFGAAPKEMPDRSTTNFQDKDGRHTKAGQLKHASSEQWLQDVPPARSRVSDTLPTVKPISYNESTSGGLDFETTGPDRLSAAVDKAIANEEHSLPQAPSNIIISRNQRRARPRIRGISSRLRGHARDEPLSVGMSRDRM
jgi:hypothetical protein